MNNTFFYIVILFLSLQACKTEENPQVQKITVEEMFNIMETEDVQIIDVRTPEEYGEGKLKTAQNLCVTHDDFKLKAEQLDKEKPVYLYCKSGRRSAKAAEILKEMGFKEIYEMPGGMDEWKQKGLDTDKS